MYFFYNPVLTGGCYIDGIDIEKLRLLPCIQRATYNPEGKVLCGRQL